MASPFDRIGRSDGAGVHAHLLVVSDSHGDLSVLDGCRSRVQERRVDAVVHLGDMGPEDWPDPVPGLGPLVAVAGNTDPAGRRLPGVRVFEAGGLRFVCVHGHLQQVKTSLALLFELAARCQADVVFYGLTRRLDERASSQIPAHHMGLDWLPPQDVCFSTCGNAYSPGAG